ncbi:MAG: Tat pathway signal protein, partial [Oricola sp.]
AAAIRAPSPSGDGPDLRYLVHHATLAANSHNTQPWRFSAAGNGVTIRPDFSRATPAADANHHHVFASLGCAAENLSLAAGAAGRSSAIGFDLLGDGAVNVSLGSGPAAVDPLFEPIAARQCTRSIYDGRAVSPDDLKLLEEAVRPTGGRVMLITDKERIGQVLEMVVAANTAQVEDPAFRAELKEWIRFGPRVAVARRDGLYSACSGNPTVPDWLGRSIFDLVFTAQSENDRYAAQIRSSSGLAIFATDANDPAHWVEAGRAYQRFALAATALGIRHAFVNQPLEVASKREQFAQWLGGGVSPDLIVRFGYAPPMPYSLRRPIDDVIAGT